MTLSALATGELEHPAAGNAATTSGVLAMINLDAQIDGLAEREAAGLLDAAGRAELIELVAQRGHVLGRITDLERALSKAESLCAAFAEDGTAHLARARRRAGFHRFAAALEDVDTAERLGAAPSAVAAERAAVLQALGRFDEALTLFEAAATRSPDFANLGALAVLHAERGDPATAEPLFDRCLASYRHVSPIPLALLDFQRGHMWMAQGELRRAGLWFTRALALLPDYAPAAGHLAEVDADLGERASAVSRLRPLAASSDDPEYAALLARLLPRDDVEGRDWQAKAAARYADLVGRHREAFADHAADFWLGAGNDPPRALALARANLEVRQTPRAYRLLRRAKLAAGEHPEDSGG